METQPKTSFLDDDFHRYSLTHKIFETKAVNREFESWIQRDLSGVVSHLRGKCSSDEVHLLSVGGGAGRGSHTLWHMGNQHSYSMVDIATKLWHSSVASPICQEGQSERTFPIFAFSSWFFIFFPAFSWLLPSSSRLLAYFSLLRVALCPRALPPVATPLLWYRKSHWKKTRKSHWKYVIRSILFGDMDNWSYHGGEKIAHLSILRVFFLH